MKTPNFILASFILASQSAIAVDRSVDETNETETSTQTEISFLQAQPEHSAWAVSLDNDLFVPGKSDRDFTAGLAVTYSGKSESETWSYIDNGLESLNSWLNIPTTRNEFDLVTPSIEFGTYGFTPGDIEQSNVLFEDRPYSSLIYLSTSRSYRSSESKSSWTTSFTLGALGLDVFENLQNEVHSITGSDEARGWGNQISEGGELTARYQVAYHQPIETLLDNSQLKLTYFGSAGFLTEAGVALTYRNGLISSPDHRFNPALAAYGEQVSTGVDVTGGQESYFWGGVALKARAYNAFLQGQFRDSVHTLDHNDLRTNIAEAWLGYTKSLGSRYKLSYVIRAQSSEIKNGEGDRSLSWGGLVLSKSLI